MEQYTAKKPKTGWQSPIKLDAFIGFCLAFFLAWTDNLRDMILALGGTLLYVLCEIAERLKGK